MKPVKAREHDDDIVDHAALEQATELGRTRGVLRAVTLQFMSSLNAYAIGFADQTALLLPVANYPELRNLSVQELEQMELGFGGGALCLESRDLHISVAGMISASESLMAMAASVVASRNGRRSTEAKTKASRANGLKGGRPRKVIVAP
jgi:hypothetical protein